MDDRRRRRQSTLRDDERSLSDTIGFVLTFAIVIASVGLVSVIGLGQLDDFSTDQQLRNAETTFELIARSYDEIEEGQTTVRTDALELSGGQVFVDTSSSAAVTVAHGGSDYQESFPLGSLVYRADGTAVVYENGATFRGSDSWDSGILNHEPEYVCTDRTAVVSFVTVVPARPRTIGGQGTLRVTGRETNTTLLYPTADSGVGTADDATSVTFEIDSPRAKQWRQYFEDSSVPFDASSGGSTATVTCDGVDNVYVRRTVIQISFDS